jgi:hypothetical protein
LAVRLLTEHGVSSDRAEVVWDAIALHMDREIALRKRPEIALVAVGAGFDLGGGPDALPDGYADRVHRLLPRLHAAAVLHDSIVSQALTKPHKAPPFTMRENLCGKRPAGPGPAGSNWPALRAGTITTATALIRRTRPKATAMASEGPRDHRPQFRPAG